MSDSQQLLDQSPVREAKQNLDVKECIFKESATF